MSPETHQRARQLFDEALTRPEAERTTFLQAACGGNTEVLGQVTLLLSAHAEATSFPEAEPPRPQRIGRYVVSGELGRGAMGIVYRAIDPLIGRDVAVKIIRLQHLADGAETAFLRERLFREARSAGLLFHPGIAVILDVGQEGEVPFIAMEYVEGPSLFRMLAASPKIGRTEALQILQQTAAALDFAHAHGVVHRDVKPANILLEKGVTVKVADFGIAKIASSPQYTKTGMTMGTPSYMSPEQLDAKPLDGRSDQFSLAVVAYELLTGVQPFRAESFTALVHTIAYGPRPSARAANPELPAGVDQVFHRGLAKLPEERYASCRELVAALERALSPGDDVETRATVLPLGAPAVANRGGRPFRYIVGGAVAATLLTAAGLGYMWMHRAPVVVSKAPPVATVQTALPPAPEQQLALPSVMFGAVPDSILAGAETVLIWKVSGATKVKIEPAIGTMPATGHVIVKPSETTSYTLTTIDAVSTARGLALVVVTPKPPDVAAAKSADQLYLDGESKLRNRQLTEGVALLTKAGALGDVRAMLALGETYFEKGDKQREMYWYQKAAEKGDVLGMLDLAGIYEAGGSGVPPNYELAAQWFRKAAAHNSSSATYSLAQMYEQGRGVPRDLKEARRLYQRAADMGSLGARNWLARHREEQTVPAPAGAPQIEVGQALDQIVAALGVPMRIVNMGGKKIYVYKDLKVTFVEGKVIDVQ
jgi:tRNA A-37 threonylcarbamoyl transferase component Bud32